MTVYTTIPQSDANLDVTLTESNDIITLDINPAAVSVSGAVSSVNGLSGAVVLDSDDILQGTTNLYATNPIIDARVDLQTGANLDLSFKTTTDLTEGTNLYYTQSRFDSALAAKSTTDLTEGTNLYYTDARVNTFLTDGSVTSVNFENETSLSWNPTDQTLDMPLDGITIQLGQESVVRVVNKSGTTILNGQVVSVTGSQGNRMSVDFASNVSDDLSKTVLGVATEDIPNNAEGFITALGLVRDIDTSALIEGQPIYLGVNGGLTSTLPISPAHEVLVGYCVRSSATVGSIFIKAQNGYELSELHDVLITTPVSGQVIQYNGATQLWQNQTLDFVTDAELGVIIGSTLTSANAYADSQDVITLSSANAYTDSQVSSVVVPVTTDDLPEGLANEYFTDARAISALENNADTTLTGNLTVNGDFVVLEQVKINNFEFPLTNIGRTDQWVSNAYDLDASNAYTKFQLRTNDPVITFNTSNFFDDVNNLRTIYIQVDYRGGNGGIDWPANVVWDNQTEPNFATGGNDRHIVVMTGNGTNGWFAYVEQVVNPANPSSLTGKLSHYNLLDVGNITDGTAGQVLSTNANGTFSFVDQSGGGGGGALEDLTDVSILNLQNNDLLIYNATALEWQNTNLGISVTPTLSGDATTFTGSPYTFTVTNHATYDDINYFVEVYDGATLVVANSAVTDNGDGTLTFGVPATATTYQIRVKAQDFGDLQSEIGTLDFDAEAFGGTFRYWRMTDVTCVQGNWWMLADIRYYSAPGQSGTAYPPNMTSATTPSPYVVLENNIYNASYPGWKAMDSNTTSTFFWTIGSSNGPADWLQIDFGSSINIQSMYIKAGNNQSYAPTSFKIYGSDTGAFAGEETLITSQSGLPSVAGQVTNVG